MAQTEKVTIDSKGRVQRSNKRKLRHRKIDKFTQSTKRFTRSNLENLTMSDKHYDHGVFKNARVMKNNKSAPINPNNPKEIHVRGTVKYPYDDRCHPHNASRE